MKFPKLNEHPSPIYRPFRILVHVYASYFIPINFCAYVRIFTAITLIQTIVFECRRLFKEILGPVLKDVGGISSDPLPPIIEDVKLPPRKAAEVIQRTWRSFNVS